MIDLFSYPFSPYPLQIENNGDCAMLAHGNGRQGDCTNSFVWSNTETRTHFFVQRPNFSLPADLSLSQDDGSRFSAHFLEWAYLYFIDGTHKQSSLLGTIFNYICYFGTPGKHLQTSQKNNQETGRHVVGFGDLSIFVFLGVPNTNIGAYCI